MIGIDDARHIVFHLDPSRIVRLAYRAAVREPRAGLAVVVLDLSDGTIRVVCWRASEGVEMPLDKVVLAFADRALVEAIEERYAEACELPPSPELLEETVARAAASDDIGVSWSLLEVQLRLAYEFAQPEYEPGDRCSGSER